jgi:1,4-alpha-glucan branching enzyme
VTWREILNTDYQVYGGTGMSNGEVRSENEGRHGLPQSLVLKLPPMSVLMLKPVQPLG